MNRDTISSESPIELSIALDKNLLWFISTNDMSIGGKDDLLGIAENLRFIKDNTPITFQSFIALRFLDKSQGFDLPPGRTLTIGQAAGIIQDFSMTIFDEPRAFTDAVSFISSFMDDLRRHGWRAQGTVEIPQTPEQVEIKGGWKIVAQLKDDGENTAEVRIVDVGLAPKSESWIIPPLGPSDRASGRYLVQVSVFVARSDEVSSEDIVNPRRVFVNGDRNAKIPLQLWLDDPNWTPQAAGMVPAPPEVRAQSDHTNWIIPPKAP